MYGKLMELAHAEVDIVAEEYPRGSTARSAEEDIYLLLGKVSN